jgi:hypothetical protein
VVVPQRRRAFEKDPNVDGHGGRLGETGPTVGIGDDCACSGIVLAPQDPFALQWLADPWSQNALDGLCKYKQSWLISHWCQSYSLLSHVTKSFIEWR